MPSGLESLLSNPRRLRQYASTPGNYESALAYASQDSPARVGRRPASRTSTAKTPGTLETGEIIEQVALPDGSLVKPATESGKLVKAPGKSNLYLDPATGEPYQPDPTKPTGLRSAYETARQVKRDGKVFQTISGVGEREIGPDPKVAEDATKAAAKREAENRRLALAREKRPYNIDRVTGEPVPLQTDEEWAAAKQAKAAKLDESARVKRLKDQADVIDLEADRISLTAPKPAKEDEEAFTAAESALSQFAAGQDMEEVAAKYAAAPATDEASQQAKAAAENYLAYKDKVKPAKEAEKKVQELKLRALDIKEQIINPQKWKEGKTASLAALPDDDLVAEVQAQAEIINEQEEQAVGTLDFITKGRNKIVEEINAFQEERRLQSEQGLNAEELEALNLQQARLEQSLADYDEHNGEAKAESDAALKAAADRRDVLAVAGTELEGRAAKQAEAAGLAKAKADTMAKAKPLYEKWAKRLYSDDWRTEEETPRLAQEAAKAGLDVASAKEALQTYRQLDWSNTRRDAKTGQPIAEEVRTLPDGNVTVNPTMWGDAEAYKKAVEASQGTPEGKAKALEAFPKLQEIHAEKAVEILSQSANIPGADNFMAWRERKIEEDQATQGKLGFARQSPARQAIAYMEEMKNRSWFRKAGEQVALGLLAGFQDIATQALGVGGMVTGSETLADLAAANAENTQSVVGAQSLEGSDTDYALRVMGMGARMTPAVAAMISGAGAVGGGLGTAAVLAGGQTAGSMFADLYRTAKEDAGLSHGEAWRKAALPAALAGTITGLLTKGMGATGLERVFSDSATQETARNTFKAMLGQFVKGAAEELPEEIADEYFTTILQESAASADPVATFKNFAASLPELAGVTALMGGAGALMQARRQAGTEGPGMAPPPEGEAPAMPVQPRPAGPAPTPAPETATEQDPIEAAAVAGLVAPKRPNPIEAAAQAGLVAPVRPRPQEVEAAATAGLTAPSAISRAIANQIAKFNPTGATPLPQSVAATAKRTGRPPAAVARQAAAGVVKIAQGQSLESLDIEEQEALGFVNKGGKITPDTKVTPLVYLYKDKPVLRNAAAEWLTDEAQEGLAGIVNLTEAERKAQIDAEEAAAKAKPAAKKKAGQATAAKAESTPQAGPEVKTSDSLSENEGSTPSPATTLDAEMDRAHAEWQAGKKEVDDAFNATEPHSKERKEAREKRKQWEEKNGQVPPPSSSNPLSDVGALSNKDSDTKFSLAGTGWRLTGAKETSIRGKTILYVTNGKEGRWVEESDLTDQHRQILSRSDEPAPANEPETVQLPTEQPQGQVPEVVPVVPEQPPAPAQEAPPEPAPAASQPAEPALTPKQADQMERAQADHEKSKATIQRMENDPEIRAKKLYAEGMRFAAIKRQITGKLTAKEAENKAKREASNYEGKAVSVDGKNAEVIGNAFGKVKVKFADGTKTTVPAEKVKPPVEAGPEAKPAALDHPAIKPHMQPKHQARVQALEAQGVQVVTVETEEDAAKVLGVPLKRKGNRGVTAMVNGKPVVIFIAKNFAGKKDGGAVITEELHHAAALVVLQQNPELLNEALAEIGGLNGGTAIYSKWDSLTPLGKLIEAAAAYASGKWNPDASSPVKRLVDAIMDAISKAFGLDSAQAKTATAKAIRSLADSADALLDSQPTKKEAAPQEPAQASQKEASQPAPAAKPPEQMTPEEVVQLEYQRQIKPLTPAVYEQKFPKPKDSASRLTWANDRKRYLWQLAAANINIPNEWVRDMPSQEFVLAAGYVKQGNEWVRRKTGIPPWKGVMAENSAIMEYPRVQEWLQKKRENAEIYAASSHSDQVNSAVWEGDSKPSVNAAAVEAYQIKLPAGYVREGDLYVYRPEASPAPASQEAGQAEGKPAFREYPTDKVYDEGSPYHNALVRSTVTEDMVKSARRTADAQEVPAYIGGRKESATMASSGPYVTTKKADISYVLATVYPDGKVELEKNVFRLNPSTAGRAQAEPVPESQTPPPQKPATEPETAGQSPAQAVKEVAQPPRPATPEGRAEAALAEYVTGITAGLKEPATKAITQRKLDLAKRLSARLKAMTGVVDYDIYKPELRAKSGELEVNPVGILFINPEKLINRLAEDFTNTEKARSEMDAWMLHEFIHLGALAKMDAKKITSLYESLTPEAKEASRKLYFRGKPTQFNNDFQAAHEWFAQQVEAILRGEIANSGDIKGLTDPTLRESMIALLRDFVAQLRDIAATLQGKNPAMAAEIRAQAEAVGKIASDMAAKAGLELGRAEGGQATEAKPASPADVIRQHLDADDADSALAVFNGMTKEEINKTAQAVFGRGFYNNTKTEMLAALSQWLPDSTKSVMQNLAKQSAIASAKRALKTAKENQSRHAEGILGMPTTDQAFKSVSEAEGKDPHGIGKEAVAKAWQKEVDDAQAKLDALEGQAPATLVTAEPSPAAQAPAEAPEAGQAAEPASIEQRITAAEAAGVVLSEKDKSEIRRLDKASADFTKQANRLSGYDPMNKGTAFPMGVGFTKMTKRASQRIDTGVKKAGEAVVASNKAKAATAMLDNLLAGKGTDADKVAKAARAKDYRREVVNKLLNWKKGDKVGAFEITRINKNSEGYPTSYNFKGEGIIAGVNDKIDVVREVFKGDRAEFEQMVNAAKQPSQPAQAPAEGGQGAKPSKAEAGIADFGEKILGARKDLWGKYKRIIEQDLPDSMEDVTLAKNVPEPDYEAAIANGVPVEALAVLKAIRDVIPPKPKKMYKLKNWGEAVKFLHKLTQDTLASKSLDPSLLTALEKTSRISGLAGKIALYQHLGYPLFTKAKPWTIGNWDVRYFKGQKLDNFTPATVASKDDRSTDMLVLRTGKDAFNEVADMIKAQLQKEAESPTPDKPKTKEIPFNIYRDRFTNDHFIGRKGINGVVRLKAGFSDVKAARQYLADNKQALEEQWEGMKIKPDYRRTVNQPRQGPERRDGDVTPEMFQSTFGFRGVQFGNWVEGDRRQTDLNQAFDALIDLAEILGVPPKAMSLDGSLGLAFGARGTAGAKAHYEPGEVVINLTKETGPGSLAHEWFHAFDNYFARLDTTGETKARSLDKFATSNKKPAQDKMRPAVWEAFKRIRTVLDKGTFAARSKSLDDARSKPYYSTLVEKAARAFEQYTVDRLAGKEIANDYLVNLVKDESPALPTQAEMDKDGIRAAYDNLFNVLDAVDTDTGVRLQLPPADKGQPAGLGLPPGGVTESQFNDKLDELQTLDLEDDQFTMPKFNAAKDNFVDTIVTGEAHLMVRGKDEVSPYGAHELFIVDNDDTPIGFVRLTKKPEQVSINMIHVDEDYRGRGIGSEFYRYWLDKGVSIKSDKEITEGTVAIYQKLAREGYGMDIQDGRAVLLPKAQPALALPPGQPAVTAGPRESLTLSDAISQIENYTENELDTDYWPEDLRDTAQERLDHLEEEYIVAQDWYPQAVKELVADYEKSEVPADLAREAWWAAGNDGTIPGPEVELNNKLLGELEEWAASDEAKAAALAEYLPAVKARVADTTRQIESTGRYKWNKKTHTFEETDPDDTEVLYMPPAPEGGPAAEAEEAGEPDAAMEAFIAEQQAIAEEEAAAREALRNDPDAIDAVQASGKMSGRNLSKQFEYPEARAVYRALTAARDMLGGPETVQLDKLRKWAKETFESDPEKYVQWAADMAEDNKLLDVDEQAVLGQAFQFLTREARLTGDKNIRALLNKVGNYYLDTGTRLAQAMSARRDPLESPQERWTKALDIVFGPSEAVRRKLRILPTQAGKARRIASLEAELAEARGSRRADVEAALKTARAQETKEELLEKDDAESQKIKERVLKNIGVTEDDLMLSGTDRVALQSAILNLPAVKAGLEAYKGKDNDGYNIMRLAFRGFSDAHIANALNLNQDDVGQFIHDATNAIIRPAVAEQVKAGTGFGGLIKAGFARLKKAVGLGLPPKAIEDQPSLIKGTRQTVDDVTTEVNRVMKYALQSAKARNSGKLMSKVVMTPGGQRVRVFVPFDPDDMANYYAFAREYTAAKASAFDKVYEYWINWPLLSGPQTQVANITGNAAQVAWHYTGQRLAEATLNLAYQDPNAPQFREFKHILKGFWQGIGPAFEMARQTFLTEGDTIRHKYLGEPMQIDMVDGDLDKVGNIRASVGGQAGRISRLPGRVLRFTDAFFKTAIMYAEASAVAYRRAHVEAKRQGLKGQARATFIDTEIANTLNDTSSAVWGEVMKTAEELLFQDENMATEIVDTALGGYKGIRDLEKLLAEAEAKGDSELAAKLQKRIRSRKFVGSLMRWIFPFQRTPTNIVRAGIKKAGGSAISLLYGLTRAGWLAMGKNGVPMIKSYPKAMQIKDASETLLAGLGWLALASMLEGDDNDDEKPVLLVGTRSHSLKERAATDQFLRKYGGENSIVWQDGKGKVLGSLPFGRYEPAATLLTTWIDAYRNYQEVKRLKSQGENASYSTYMLSSLVSSLEDKSFLQGFANAMQFIRDVEEKRENPDENAGVKMLMNNVIPNLIKQPLRNMDDVLRERTTAGPGYAALPNPAMAPKLPVFAAQPKISTTGERLPKAFTPPARLLFQANTKVTPQPDALLYRANRLHPTKRWSPQPLQRDDYTADPPGKAKPVPITDPAKKRQFAELAGRLYASKAAQVAARAMPSEKAQPGESLIKAFKKAREDAMAAARAQAHAMGLHKATATP